MKTAKTLTDRTYAISFDGWLDAAAPAGFADIFDIMGGRTL